MFTVIVETAFTAQHQLTMIDRQQESLHSHDWLVRTGVVADNLNETGMVVDFVELKAKLDKILADFDGVKLEELPCFKDTGKNASAENVAKYIYDNLEQVLEPHVNLEYVEVTETPGCVAKYNK